MYTRLHYMQSESHITSAFSDLYSKKSFNLLIIPLLTLSCQIF
jgi:hypothetical protein